MAIMALIPVLSHSATAVAAPVAETREAVVHKTTTTILVDLNDKTVVCSRADYAMPVLKVLIPGLSDITLLNHQNFRAGAPCVTTGETCARSTAGGFAEATPESILQGRSGTEQAEVTVTLSRIETIDHKEKTCVVTMREDVETTIRGKRLFHNREADIGSRVYTDCTH